MKQILRKTGLIRPLLLMLVLLLGEGNVKTWAETVTYTISSKNTLTTTGTAPTGSSASIVETYSTYRQMTKGNSQTLTLSGYNGYKITKITLSMHSNASGGQASLAYSTNGGSSYTYIVGSPSQGIGFNQSVWNGAWSSTYVDISKDVSIEPTNSNLVIKIAATANSIYCQSYTLTYEKNNDQSVATTTTINVPNNFNTDVNTNTVAGTLTATVSANDVNIDGATVTWSSSNEDVATIDANGAVTLVAEGTTTITASYAGEENKHKASLGTYVLNVTDSSILTIWSEDFSSFSNGTKPSGGTYNYASSEGTTVYTSMISAGGESPELMVAKNNGTFSATIPLNNCEGNLTLSFKSNAKALSISTTTRGISISGTSSFNTLGTHYVTFTGVTTNMTSITIVFTATNKNDNVRLDDILLRGKAQPNIVEVPTFSINSGTYYSAQSVELTCATEGATIKYSYDNETWNDYSSALTISETQTIYTKAVMGNIESTVSSITVTIAEKNNVEFNITDIELVYDETYTITKGTYNGRDVITDGNITLSSDNGAVASVSEMTITAKAVGTATITLTTAEGETYKAGNKTITVTVVPPTALNTAPETPLLFRETFKDAAGTGPSGDSWSGTIASADFKSDNEGWTAASAYSGEGCARFGTGSANGSATTPAITFDGTTTYNLSFKAGAWNNDGTTLTISCDDENAEIGTTTFTMLNNAWSNYSTTIKAANGSKITFATNSHRFFLDDIKVSEPATINVTLNASGYATYCSQYPLDFTNAEGYTAWQITSISSDNVITFEKVAGPVKGGTGLLLKGEAGATVTLTSADSETELDKNLLFGTLAPTYISAGEYYGLSGKTFVKVNAGTVPAGKALLPANLVTESTGNVKAFTFVFNDLTTGVNAVDNGQWTMDNGAIFDLSGRRLSKPAKGINIINGKKVVVK